MDCPVFILLALIWLLSFASCTHPARLQLTSSSSTYDYRPIGQPSPSSKVNPSAPPPPPPEQIPSPSPPPPPPPEPVASLAPPPPPLPPPSETISEVISINVTWTITPSPASPFTPSNESSRPSPSAPASPFSRSTNETSPRSPSVSPYFKQPASSYFNKRRNMTVRQQTSSSSPKLPQTSSPPPKTEKITRRGYLKLGIAIAVIVVSLVILTAVYKAFNGGEDKRVHTQNALEMVSHNDNGNNLEAGEDSRAHTVKASEIPSQIDNGNNLEAGEDRRARTVKASEIPSQNDNGNNLERGEDKLAHTVKEPSSKVGIGLRTYTLQEIIKATDNYGTPLGKGASGYVYRANLPGNITGAVKKANPLEPTLFNQELSVLLRLPRHPHLVDLIGLCSEPDAGEQILVFEYVSKWDLADRLHKEECNKGPTGPLSWESRMDIAYQVAVALQYLHEEIKPPILHRDVKSANVLLVDDNCAKLADFGLSKLGPKDNQSTVTKIRGTPSYWDPHYVKTGRYSAKSDVYSFGVLLLEIITGLKSGPGGDHLAEWTQPYRLSEAGFMTIVDQNMKRDHININMMQELKHMIKIADLCLRDIIVERPSMGEITNMMKKSKNRNGNLSDGAETPFLGNGNDGGAPTDSAAQ